MTSLPKCCRVKRPTILAKRSQLAKKNLYKTRSYKPLYEKLKANNHALAKALSKEKQEYQYLVSQNIMLTGEVQELGVACNRRDDIISGVLKNAKESLQLLIALSGHVTNTIASCQQVVTTARFTPRKSASATERRESTRRLSGKSPARGVVQPMVSGHMITKPTINLSRLNIQREYRVTTPPNLSDIDEMLATPEQSPVTVQPTTPIRVPITRPLNLGLKRVDRLPERLQGSLRTSDEDDRHSSVEINRNSCRYSGRRSRPCSGRKSSNSTVPRRSNSDATEIQEGERLKSPRVALHDVSRLLHNSQSVNIRTLLHSSSDLDLTHSQQNEETSLSENLPINELEATTNRTISQDLSANLENKMRPNISELKESKKQKNTSQNDTDDPLEGPSWLLNDSEVASSPCERITTIKSHVSVVQKTQDDGRNHQSSVNNENKNSHVIEEQIAPYALSRLRQQKSQVGDRNDHEDDQGDKRNDIEDDEQTVNLATRWANYTANFYHNLNDDHDDHTETNIVSFVTRKRGSNVDDADDFTLMWRPQQTAAVKNFVFGLNDLELPVLESPIVTATEIRPPEPEETTKVLRINTPNFMSNPAPVCSPVNDNDSFYDHRGLVIPSLPENPDSRHSSIIEQDEQSDEDDLVLGKRKRPYKRLKIFDSSSDLEYMPTPKSKNTKQDGKIECNKKDPSSAKVVLKKLNDNHVKKRCSSPENLTSQDIDNHQQISSTLMNHEPSSDSEVSSNASSNKLQARVPERPRRQKAPKNLQEPSLGKKMRRN